MNYIQALIARWSRRDWLAVLVVALVAALLVGTTLLVVTAGTETTELASEFEADGTVTQYDTIEEARAVAGSEAVVLPTATATNEDGDRTRVVGIPENADQQFGLPAQPADATGPVSTDETWTLDGEQTAEQIVVEPGGERDVVPETWIRVDAAVVESVGPKEALVIEHGSDQAADEGAPLISVLSFFVAGTGDVMGILWGGVAIAGVVVAVTIANVVHVVIVERRRTIRVARATGATPRRIQIPLAIRAGLLTATGATLGYAFGLIIPNVAVNLAVFLGLPTTLTLQVTPEIALVLCAMLGVIVGIGMGSGYLTAWRATTGTVFSRTSVPNEEGSGDQRMATTIKKQWQPSLLSSRTVLPATATLTAFAVLVFLVASLGGVGASLTTADTTLTEAEAAHPVNSAVPEGYAAAINESGVAASPEIILFGQHDGDPYLARGGDYDAFSMVTGAELLDGREPAASDEVLAGTKAAEMLDLAPGDELVVGGSTDSAIGQVTVVGVYRTDGIDDHQLFVPLETARHLSNTDPGYVNAIRTNSSMAAQEGDPVVLHVDAPTHTAPNGTVEVRAAVWNPTDETQQQSVPLTLGDNHVDRHVTLAPQELTPVEFDIETPSRGEYTLAVGSNEQSLTVREPSPFSISIPREAPPETAVQALVDTGETPAENVTVTVAGEEVSISDEKTVWFHTPAAEGTYEIVVEGDGVAQATREEFQVTDDAERRLVPTVEIDPSSPTVEVRPAVTTTLWNPWNDSIDATVTIDGPGTEYSEVIEGEPGEETTVVASLDRRPPGEYTVTATADGQLLHRESYRVEGDDRLASALASGGHYDGGGGLGNAIEYAVGNLSVLLSALLVLTAVTVVGAMSAVLSRAVRARRRTLGVYRATGASPRRVLRVVAGDAVRIGVVSAALAAGAGLVGVAVFDTAGLLTAFGVTLSPWPSVTVLLFVFLAGVVLTLVAAVVSTVPLLRERPQTSLSE